MSSHDRPWAGTQRGDTFGGLREGRGEDLKPGLYEKSAEKKQSNYLFKATGLGERNPDGGQSS